MSLQIIWPSGEDAPRILKDEKEKLTAIVFRESGVVTKWLARKKFCEHCQGGGMVSVGENTSAICPVCYGFTISEWTNFCDLREMGVPLYELLEYGSQQEYDDLHKTMLPLIGKMIQRKIDKNEVIDQLEQMGDKYPASDHGAQAQRLREHFAERL